jgi:hypothetical protein
MATGTAGQNAAGLQSLSDTKRTATAASAPRNGPEGKQILMTASGNASATSFTVAHGLTKDGAAVAPSTFFLEATSLAASALHYITKDDTNLTVVFAAAPANAANNITFVGWAYF